MIAWCGSRADGLGWLSDRCSSIDNVEIADSLSIQGIDAICNRHPRRLILAIENRLNYPLAEILHLQRSWPEVPFALAVGSWFDGSRRTGIGMTSHLSLPWYRWWDDWRQWLVGSHAELLNPWHRAVLGRAFDAGSCGQSSPSTGVIVSNCQQTSAAWQARLYCAPTSTQLQTLAEFHALISQPTKSVPDWVLWDDSCLDTFAGPDCILGVADLFANIRQRFPGTVILAATCMPRWSDWQQWKSAGADELIAKPSQGFLLSEVFAQFVN